MFFMNVPETFPGSFIAYYIERLVYPDVNPLLVLIPTYVIASITIIVFIMKPPEKIKTILKKIAN